MYENDLYYNIYYFQFCPQLKYKKKLLGGVDEYTLEQKYAKLWWLVIVVTCKSSVCLYSWPIFINLNFVTWIFKTKFSCMYFYRIMVNSWGHTMEVFLTTNLNFIVACHTCRSEHQYQIEGKLRRVHENFARFLIFFRARKLFGKCLIYLLNKVENKYMWNGSIDGLTISEILLILSLSAFFCKMSL